MKSIKYVVNPDGSVTLDFNGFRGKLCDEEFQKILAALKEIAGITADDIQGEVKPEYYAEQEEVIEQ